MPQIERSWFTGHCPPLTLGLPASMLACVTCQPHLHNSGFMLGDAPSRLMKITCQLAVDDAGCVHSLSYGEAGERTGLVWPDNYAARTGAGGLVEIVDLNGQVVAREGDTITAAGGFGEATPSSECAHRYREYLVIGSEVRRLGPL